MTESLGALLSSSFAFAVAHSKVLLIGALVFATFTFGGQTAFEGRALSKIEDSIGSFGMMEEFAERIEGGDEEAFQEMMMQIGVMGEDGELDEGRMEEMAKGMMMGLLPAFGLLFVVSMLISLLSYTYYTVVAVTGEQDLMAAVSRSGKVLLPMVGVWIWAIIRSFAWIPVIGIIFGFVLMPRLMFGGVILVKEGTGVMDSVRLSYERTQGYWGKIVGNIFITGLLIGIATGIISMPLSMTTGSSMVIATAVTLVVSQLAMAYMLIFTVKLAETVMADTQPVESSEPSFRRPTPRPKAK